MAYDGTAPAEAQEDLTGRQIGTLTVKGRKSPLSKNWSVVCTECNSHYKKTYDDLTQPVPPSCKYLRCPTNAELMVRIENERAEKERLDKELKALEAKRATEEREEKRLARERAEKALTKKQRAARERIENERELKRLEKIVRSGITDYLSVGEALKAIRTKKLYRLKLNYKSFETYCEKEWGFTRSTAHDYLHAVEVVESVGTSLQISLSKAVALYGLRDTEQRKEVIALEGFATMTVRELIAEVKKRLPQPEPTAEPTPEQRVIHLVTAAKKEFSGAVSKMKELPANSAEYASLIAELEAALADLRKLKTEQLAPVVVESQDELKPVQTQAA